MKLLILLLTCCCFLTSRGQNREAYQLFYLSIGSSHYINDELTDSSGETASIFRNIKGANKSARLISDFFRQKGGKGLAIVSDEDDLISRDLFFTSIDSIKKSIIASKAAHPFLIYYYCGHGISEVVTEMRYLIPGDMRGHISRMNVDEKKANAVCLNDIYLSLEKLRIPFIILLDCCADREMEIGHLSNVFNKTAEGNIRDILKVLAVAASIKGNYPVLCSSRLGASAYTVPDPSDSTSKILVGPVCRRMLISSISEQLNHVDTKTFLTQLVNVKDRETPVPVLLCADHMDKLKHSLLK